MQRKSAYSNTLISFGMSKDSCQICTVDLLCASQKRLYHLLLKMEASTETFTKPNIYGKRLGACSK